MVISSKNDSTIESEIAYTKSNMNLPASMTKTEFEEFKQTGEQNIILLIFGKIVQEILKYYL